MRILIDEDVEHPIIARLRSDGHSVEAIAEQTPGMKDIPILARAVAQRILLLTADLDFGAYIFRDGQPAPHEGVVLYRLGEDIATDRKAAIIAAAFAQHAGSFAGNFTVIDEHNVRFRPLVPPTSNASHTPSHRTLVECRPRHWMGLRFDGALNYNSSPRHRIRGALKRPYIDA